MKKMKVLFSQIYLLALLALPFVATSCSDDEDPKAEITSLGIENGTMVNIGQKIQLEAQVNNLEGEISYAWQLDGKDVSTEKSYTFVPDKKAVYNITLIAKGTNLTVEKSVSIKAQMYQSTFYVINEGWFGNTTGSVNSYSLGEWTKNIVSGLGNTTTVGIIDKDYMYIVSKTKPVLTKMKVSTSSETKNIEREDIGQGNNFCIINQETAIITTTTGAYKVDLSSFTVGDKLIGSNQCKDVYKTDKYIFILNDMTIKVYNVNDFSFKQDLTVQAKTGFACTKNGMLWAANEKKLAKINPNTLETQELELPSELSVYYNQWNYVPSCLKASTTENCLYFAHLTAAGFSVYGKDIYKYNTETKSATKFFSTPADDQSIYGAGIQVDPRNGDVFLIYTEDGFGEHYLNTNIYVADGTSGTQKAIIDYSGTYWFPSTITFQ